MSIFIIVLILALVGPAEYYSLNLLNRNMLLAWYLTEALIITAVFYAAFLAFLLEPIYVLIVVAVAIVLITGVVIYVVDKTLNDFSQFQANLRKLQSRNLQRR